MTIRLFQFVLGLGTALLYVQHSQPLQYDRVKLFSNCRGVTSQDKEGVRKVQNYSLKSGSTGGFFVPVCLGRGHTSTIALKSSAPKNGGPLNRKEDSKCAILLSGEHDVTGRVLPYPISKSIVEFKELGSRTGLSTSSPFP